jgi:hypothetical protein
MKLQLANIPAAQPIYQPGPIELINHKKEDSIAIERALIMPTVISKITAGKTERSILNPSELNGGIKKKFCK